MLDFLSNILIRLSMRGTLYFRTSLTTPWGIDVPEFENVVRFHFAHRGNCLIEVDGSDKVVVLAQGDLLLIPHGASHRLYCSPETKEAVLPLDTVIERSGFTGSGVLVYGGNEDDRDTQLICGHFSFEPYSKHVLMERLPHFIHLKSYGETAGKWMEATLRVIGDEAGGHRLGGDLIALKMSEAVLAQAIRTFVESDESFKWGLNGFSDKHLSKALDAFHKKPNESWTVQSMGQCAGMSRTNFAVQFQKNMGMPPMQYVSAWRMEIAKQYLADTSKSLSDVAQSVGYASDSAFTRAFKKEIGMTPTGFRKKLKN